MEFINAKVNQNRLEENIHSCGIGEILRLKKITQKTSDFLSNEVKQTHLFINGKFTTCIEKDKIEVLNPSDESILARVPSTSFSDCELAITSARNSFDGGVWRFLSIGERKKVVSKLIRLLENAQDYLSWLEMAQSGTPCRFILKTSDVVSALSVLRDYVFSKQNCPDLQPTGVLLCALSWEQPLTTSARIICDACDLGDSVIIKADASSPLLPLALAELIPKAGFPVGVFNVITGGAAVDGYVKLKLATCSIDKIILFGEAINAAVASSIRITLLSTFGVGEAAGVAAEVEKTSGNMQLVPIVAIDVDSPSAVAIIGMQSQCVQWSELELDAVVESVATSAFCRGFSDDSESGVDEEGRTVARVGRVYVHADMYYVFMHKLKIRIDSFAVGDAFDPMTSIGPLPTWKHYHLAMQAIEMLYEKGATLERGGVRIGSSGYFLSPTLFTGVTDEMLESVPGLTCPAILCITVYNNCGVCGVPAVKQPPRLYCAGISVADSSAGSEDIYEEDYAPVGQPSLTQQQQGEGGRGQYIDNNTEKLKPHTGFDFSVIQQQSVGAVGKSERGSAHALNMLPSDDMVKSTYACLLRAVNRYQTDSQRIQCHAHSIAHSLSPLEAKEKSHHATTLAHSTIPSGEAIGSNGGAMGSAGCPGVKYHAYRHPVACVFTSSLHHAHVLSHGVNAEVVQVNTLSDRVWKETRDKRARTVIGRQKVVAVCGR